MRLFLLLIMFFTFSNCNKPKTVLICGDHVCINKAEADQFFEENLTLEVKIIDNKVDKEIDLVELNLQKDSKGEKNISVLKKKKTKKNLKVLTNEEIRSIKKNIKEKKKFKEKKIIENKPNFNEKKLTKKVVNKDKIRKKEKSKEMSSLKEKATIDSDNVNKNKKEVVDVCSIIEKCNIDEISKYLIDQGKKKGFPDITKKQ